MTYGNYKGPDKADKGQEDGSCNRTLCQDFPANWYNHGSMSWYCRSCMMDLVLANDRDWQRDFYPRLKHPMFETRKMMDDRKKYKVDCV